MGLFSDDQLRMAFGLWYPNFGHQDADKVVLPFLKTDMDLQQCLGSLKRTRQALLLSTGEVASRLGISRPSYARLEMSEAMGTIKLETLAKAADALDCELIYVLRPKSRRAFSQIVWEQLVKEVSAHAWVQPDRPDSIRIRSLASLARDKLQDPRFRRRRNWTERWSSN